MKKKLIKFAKTFLPLLIGIFLIWYSLSSATPQERQELWNNIKLADMKWVVLSVIFGILSHVSRAYRWKYLLEPLGYRPRFANSFMAVMAGYLANLGIPRSGEVLRGATLSTYEKVPFDKAFGTIVSERIADLTMLLIITIFGFLIQTEHLITYFSTNNINPFVSIGILLAIIFCGILFLNLVRKSSHRFMQKIREFARGLLEGMRSILRMKKKKEFLFHTLFIWLMYLLMFYIIKFAIPETHSLTIAGFMAAFIVGSFAISTTNGGIGVYPIAMGAVLLLFGINQQAGEAFGWIMWGSQTLMVLVLGGFSLLFLPIYNQKK
ncbi:lysylphosphatidylglycerol synthase transmembrane domain-containing protein [Salinimicrobium oceani]|uniref:Flippase-like domain-containing protein n=1 Tax=Salinimicrobium oceani TaxID=2722702 RepID=A0ABX1CXF4_9FLAO|nr:lysylphosphatidylglycerol synthase transmembrane domain-containing protein [Salinimicrobium oceani]NJW52939.1 flippase-like domain-containing protein [Salinimicrobium oceani]